MIKIKKEPNADSRTAKSALQPNELKKATEQHIEDVGKGLKFFADMLIEAGKNHDRLKMEDFTAFYESLVSQKIKTTPWYKRHITEERHHLNAIDGDGQGVPKDINLIDVMEHLVDCVIAGMSRSGKVYDVELSPEILKQAHKNTIDLLMKNIQTDDILDEKIDE